jgi:hypothetical protein
MKTQLKDLKKSVEKLMAEIDNLLEIEQEYKVGDWVTTSNYLKIDYSSICRIEKIRGMEIDASTITYYFNNENTYYDYEKCYTTISDIRRKLTPQETFYYLCEEAIRRKYEDKVMVEKLDVKEVNVDFPALACADHIECKVFNNKCGDGGFHYDSEQDILCSIGRGTTPIYKQGKWAKIIEQPVEVAGHKVTFLDENTIEIGCKDYVYDIRELIGFLDEVLGYGITHFEVDYKHWFDNDDIEKLRDILKSKL